MNKKEFKKKMYVSPTTRIVSVELESQLLAGSPAVRPGGSGNGTINVIPPDADEDEEIVGS